ncbi:MAG: hypothetical protein AAF678_11375 [Pseudomonadota bacterium]
MTLFLRFLRRGVLAASLALIAGTAFADMPVTYTDNNRALFSVTVPDFWQGRAGGERILTAPDSDETRLINRVIGLSPTSGDGVWVGFMSPHGVRTFAEGEAYLENIGQSVVTNPKLLDEKRITVGGRSAVQYTGTGRRDGKAVAFTAMLIDLPRDRMAVSLIVIEAGVDPEFRQDINRIYSSFRAR